MDTILYGISVVLSGLGFYLSMDRLFEHLSNKSGVVVVVREERIEQEPSGQFEDILIKEEEETLE